MVFGGLLLAGVVFGFVLGTFVEYWFHRAMHSGLILSEVHNGHHRGAMHGRHGQGILKQFRDATFLPLAVAAIGLPIDYFYISGGALAAGTVLGTLAHALFVAWVHQAQHEDPRLVPWLSKMPVHFIHHKLDQTEHNFGFSVDWWDRLFGTFKPYPEWREHFDFSAPRRPWWKLEWRDPRNEEQDRQTSPKVG